MWRGPRCGGVEILPLPSPDDNEFGSGNRPPGSKRPRLPAWVDMLGAVLLGNAFYFLLLMPRLPEAWRHQRFVLDTGLALDFLVCLGIYALARFLRAKV